MCYVIQNFEIYWNSTYETINSPNEVNSEQ